MKLLTLLLVGALLGSVSAGDPDLASLKTKFQTAIERTTDPIKRVYVEELKKLRDDRLSRKMLVEANEIDAELSAYEDTRAPIAQPSTAPATLTKSARIKVAANDPNGYRIGPVKAGDSLTVQYREGVWKSWGLYATISPDDVPAESDKCKTVIAKACPKDGPPGEVLTVVPGLTAKTPFVYTFTEDCDAVIRIADAINPKAPGIVMYSISLKRK